jgi:hypothetical protein
MNKITLRYGIYGAIVIVAVLLPEIFIFRNDPHWELQEVIGYATIVASLIFVFFGIRRWRDKENAGQLGFWKGIGIGSLISLFPSIAFGLLSVIEIRFLDPEFNDKYYAYYIEKVKQSTPPEQQEAAIKSINDAKEMFSSPLVQFFVMFLTVFVIGFIISIISTLILKRTNKSTV